MANKYKDNAATSCKLYENNVRREKYDGYKV